MKITSPYISVVNSEQMNKLNLIVQSCIWFWGGQIKAAVASRRIARKVFIALVSGNMFLVEDLVDHNVTELGRLMVFHVGMATN